MSVPGTGTPPLLFAEVYAGKYREALPELS